MSRFPSFITIMIASIGLITTRPVLAAASPLAHIDANIVAETSHDEKTSVKITLKNRQGKIQERVLHWKTVTLENGDKRSLVYFDYPKAIKGTGLLTHENKAREDERWLYLPALKKTRRISGSDKSDTFMGTDFSYEDLVTEEPENHSYVYADKQDCGPSCVLIVATPNTEKEKLESGYSKRVLTVNTDNHMIVAVEYFNKSGTHAKSYRASDFRVVHPSGAQRPFRMEMVDLINQHTTVMAFDGYKIDAGIAEADISLRALTQGQ